MGLIYELGLLASKPANALMDCNLKLTIKKYDDHVSNKTIGDELLDD